MKTFFPVNLNNKIRFKPTQIGEKILEEAIPYVLTLRGIDGYCEMELWSFAEMFGIYFCNGCNSPVEMNVEIEQNS